MLLQEMFGTRELVLVGRKEKQLLVETCSSPVAAEFCANSIFLIGGFDGGNLNVVGAPASQSRSQLSLVCLDTWR